MEKINFTFEENAGRYYAYREEPGNNLITTLGRTLSELRANLTKAYNLYQRDYPENQISEDQIEFN